MIKESIRGGRRYLLLATTMVLGGCSLWPQGWHREQPQVAVVAMPLHSQYRDHLTYATEALNEGDLEKAKSHLDRAGAFATNPKQNRKVRSLKRLVAGTEALMAGEPDTARAEWAQIEDPHLNREVRHKARLIGMDIPIVSLDDGEE